MTQLSLQISHLEDKAAQVERLEVELAAALEARTTITLLEGVLQSATCPPALDPAAPTDSTLVDWHIQQAAVEEQPGEQAITVVAEPPAMASAEAAAAPVPGILPERQQGPEDDQPSIKQEVEQQTDQERSSEDEAPEPYVLVIDYLNTHSDPQTRMQIQKALKLPQTTVYKALDKLIKSNIVLCDKHFAPYTYQLKKMVSTSEVAKSINISRLSADEMEVVKALRTTPNKGRSLHELTHLLGWRSLRTEKVVRNLAEQQVIQLHDGSWWLGKNI